MVAIKSQMVKLKEFSYIFAGQCVVNGKHVHIVYLQRYKKTKQRSCFLYDVEIGTWDKSFDLTYVRIPNSIIGSLLLLFIL